MAKPSLKQQSYELIKSNIVNCVYPPGAIITEDILCQELAVSRTPIREALSLLEKERLVTILPKRGIEVTYISLNELYGEIGLDSVKNGDIMGWNLDQGLIELTFDTCLAENDEPCVVIDYSIGPRYDFDKLM